MTEEEMKQRIAALEADNEKLKTDKQTALGEKNRAAAAAKQALEAQQEAEAAVEAATEAATAKTGDIEAIKASLKTKHDNAMKKVEAERDAALNQLNTLLIENEITKAVGEKGLPPHHARALGRELRDGAIVKDGVAYAADGTPLTEFLPAFFDTDEGRAWLPPSKASGGAAPGSTSKASKWSQPPEPYQMTEWAHDAVKDAAYHNSLADSWGRPDLKV